MITMSPGPELTATGPRAAPVSPVTEPAIVPEVISPMRSPQLASLLDRVENTEREKREQEALALLERLGRLAAFD